MRCFLDTSSLVKLYYPEEDNYEMMDKIFFNGVDEICLSTLSKVEFVSAIRKLVRQGKIKRSRADDLIQNFKSHESNYVWEKINLSHAAQLIEKYQRRDLRSLDAIQLAAAINLELDEKSDFFESHDRILSNMLDGENLARLPEY